MFLRTNTAYQNPSSYTRLTQTEKYEQEVTIEVDDDVKADQNELNNQTVLEIHKANIKDQVDAAITELFFVILVRALASLAWYLAAFLLAPDSYKEAVLTPLVISEGAVIAFTILFSKHKNKRIIPSLIDFTKICESCLIIGCCQYSDYGKYFLLVFILLSMLSWKCLFCNFLKAINETFAIRIVDISNAGLFLFGYRHQAASNQHHGQTLFV